MPPVKFTTSLKTAAGDLEPILSSFDDNLDQDPPTLQLNVLRDGTLYWDFHSSATPCAQGAGDIGAGSTAVVGGPQEVLIDLEAYPNETGYLHIRVTNGSGSSNVLTTRQITTMPVFDPADLFGASDKGFIFDPSQLALLYEDTGKTDTVDADGDSIALIVDASGKTADLSQATASRRPLYKTGGGLHWALTDTTDRFLMPFDFLDHAKDWTIVFAASLESDANGGLWGSSRNGSNTSLYWNETTADRDITAIVRTTGGETGGGRDATASAVIGTPYVYTLELVRATGVITLRKNGVLVLTDTLDTAADVATESFYSLFNNGPDGFSLGAVAKHFYAAFIDRALGYSERQQLEEWAAAKAGITL